jgi:hypothetical protein
VRLQGLSQALQAHSRMSALTQQMLATVKYQ